MNPIWLTLNSPSGREPSKLGSGVWDGWLDLRAPHHGRAPFLALSREASQERLTAGNSVQVLSSHRKDLVKASSQHRSCPFISYSRATRTEIGFNIGLINGLINMWRSKECSQKTTRVLERT